ncbi:MAG: ATP-binding protein [Stellaceae bacterium]
MLRLLRSASLRFALGYAAIFILSSFLLVGLLWWRTAAYLDREVDAVILADAQAVADRLHDFGILGALETVEDRVRAESDQHAIYLLANPALTPIAGNLDAWPAKIGARPGWYELYLVRDGKLHATRILFALLPGGYRLLVGRDVQDRVAIRRLILDGLGWAAAFAVLLAIAGGLIVRRYVLRRVEAINRTTAAIVVGDLSGRLPTRDSPDEFDQLSQTINGLLSQIQILIESVRNTSNAVAHDLRTPLAELRGRLEELLRERPPPDRTQEEVQAAVGDLDRLIGVFNALLRLSDIDGGTRLAGFRDVRLDTIAGEVVELYGPVAEAKGVALDFLPPPDMPVHGDPDLIAQAIGNLVDNAVKFSPAGGQVSLALARPDERRVRVTVRDQGPGIPDAEKGRAADRFYRGAAAQGIPGAGLGLSLVAAVARLHGGSLGLEDGNPGLVATLTLPELSQKSASR